MAWRKFLLDEDPISVSDVTKTATPTRIQATLAGNTLVWDPAAGKKLRIKFIMIFNSGAAAITVYLREGAAGTARFQAALAANSGYLMNLIGCNWELAIDAILYVNLSGAGTVDITVIGEEI